MFYGQVVPEMFSFFCLAQLLILYLGGYVVDTIMIKHV